MRAALLRVALIVGVAALVIVGVLAGASHRGDDDQCHRPLADRVGGWACPDGPTQGPDGTH